MLEDVLIKEGSTKFGGGGGHVKALATGIKKRNQVINIRFVKSSSKDKKIPTYY